jgi:Flp pilus assembly CpaE family ATPase
MSKYPVVIFDVSHTTAPVARTIVSKASRIFLVCSPTVIDLRLARTLLHEIKELRGNSIEGIDLIINRQGCSPSGEVPKSDIEAAMDCKPALFIPFEPKIFIGTEGQGKKIHEDKAGRVLVESVVSLVEDIVAEKSEAAVSSEAAGKRPSPKALLGMFSQKGQKK